MKKINESIMYLYKSYLVENKVEKYTPDIDVLQKGILIDTNCPKEVKKLAINIWGKDGYLLNQTFHKSINTVIETSMEDLIIDQIIHYITTYGFKELDIYNKDKVYIPNEKLELPDVIENIELTIINQITKDELKDKLWNLITSSIPLSSKTVEHIITLSDYLDVNKENINRVTNKEVKIALYDKLKIIPSDNIEFLRYLIYKVTKKTLLIKDKETMNILNNSDKKISLELIKAYQDEYGLIPLSEIFNRYKPLFLSLKTSKSIKTFIDDKEVIEERKLTKTEIELNSIINKISKLSKEYHKPFIPNDLDRFIIWYKDNCNKKDFIKTFKDKIKDETIWRIIKLRNYISLINNNTNERVYKIRNGRVWITNKEEDFAFDQEISNILDNIIISRLKNKVLNKKIYLEDNVNILIPQSEKQFVGNIPFSSSIEIEKDNLLVGIHWFNIDEEQVDLDLKIISNEYTIGWDASYKEGDKLVFTGDVTDAPLPLGASEYIYIDKSISNTIFSLKVNNYTGNLNDIEYDIIIAKKSNKELETNYIVDPKDIIIKIPKNIIEANKLEHSLGNIIIEDNKIKIVFTDLSTSNKITAENTSIEEILRNYLKQESKFKCNLKDYLERSGASLTNNDEDADINLSIENLNKNTIIDLFKD